MCIRFIAAWIITVGLATASANASLFSPVKVPDLIEESDLIVVGQVVNASSEVSADPNLPPTFLHVAQSAQISVDRVLKGQLPEGAHFVIERLDLSGDSASIQRGQYAIFFVRSDSAGLYHPTNRHYPALVASPISTTRGPVSEKPLAAVTAELVSVLTTNPTELANPKAGNHTLPIAVPRNMTGPIDLAQATYHEAMLALATVPNEMAVPALRGAIDSDASLSDIWIIIALADHGDIEHLSEIQNFMIDPPDELSATEIAAAWGLRRAATKFSTAEVPLLSKLLQSTKSNIREAAAMSLELNGTSIVARPLASLALKDPDPEVRAYAAVGLCKVTHSEPPVCHVQYDEASHMAYWTKWAADRGLK